MTNEEIDSLVAEKIFKYNKSSHETFSPSTNIAHAWEVVTLLIKDGHEVEVIHNGTDWVCSIVHYRGEMPTSKREAYIGWQGEDKIASVAICLAALAAKGVSVD